MRRVPFWAQALALCALFAVAGVAILDNYGVSVDEIAQRRTATAVADYALDVSEDPPDGHDRYYGVVFEMPLLMAESALGLQDSRHIYLMRHLITHLFFIAGGFFCGMLAYRIIGSRWIALLAMLMFLLHPRLYSHSFFNTKDIPFAVMLVIALYLTHRAFRKDALGAFLLCGIGVGLAINLRVFGLMLLPMILAMRALDLWQASVRAERKRILASAGIFAAAAVATVYIVHPYYWENPLRFIEGLRVLSQHPTHLKNLFMGEFYMSYAVPWNFIPVWFAITAPPVTLLLGAIGCAAVCWQAITRPLRALIDRETRFRVILLGCFVTPIVVAIALQSSIYSGWRQMYFLWAPFCLLAAVGLHYVTNIRIGGGYLESWSAVTRMGSRIRLPLSYGVAGVGLITTLTAMAALHPYEHLYFNALVDTKTPGALAKRYHLDYWRMSYSEAYRHLLARYPDGVLRVYPETHAHAAQILPQNDRKRIVFSSLHDADFYIHPRINRRHLPNLPELHSIQIYGNRIMHISAPNSDAYRHAYRVAYSDVASNGTLLARSDFDIYAHNGALHYLNANCAPLRTNDIDDIVRIFLHVFPANPADMPADRREIGFENRDFYPLINLTFSDGKCIYKQSLPDYPIARMITGEHSEGEIIWRVDIDFAAHTAASVVHDSILAGDYGEPVAQSHFNVYLRGDGLAYLKEPCAEGDTDARFFLHIVPVNPADLPADRRERGFSNMDFQFADHGARTGDICVASLDLPDYPIDRIRTGQHVSGEGAIWRVEFAAKR